MFHPRTDLRSRTALQVLLGLVLVCAVASSSYAASAPPDKPYLVEWVYKVKWGHSDEFFDIFKKYQIPILDRQKALGYVVQYNVYRPGLHTGEDERWDYRIVIVYRNLQSSTHESEVQQQLFPDRATLKREENRRWELVDSHWDLPIREIDPHSPDE
jgi:hypothetical protein